MNLSNQLISDNIDFACRLKDCLNILELDLHHHKGINVMRYKIAIEDVKSALAILPQSSPFDYKPRGHLDLLFELDTLSISFHIHFKETIDADPEINIIYNYCRDRIASAYNNVYNVYQNLDIGREL